AQTLAAYLGRASLSGQRFTQVPELINAIQSGSIKIADADWLPPDLPDLFAQWIRLAGEDTHFEISPNTKTPQVIASLANRTRIIATFDPARKGPRTTIDFEGPAHPKSAVAANKPNDAGA